MLRPAGPSRSFARDPVARRPDRAGASRRRPTRRAPRTASRGCSSSCATTPRGRRSARSRRGPGTRPGVSTRRATLTPRFLAEVDAWAMGGLAEAPVHVVVAGDTTLSPAALLPSSVFPAVQNLLLAAQRRRARIAAVDAAVGGRGRVRRAAGAPRVPDTAGPHSPRLSGPDPGPGAAHSGGGQDLPRPLRTGVVISGRQSSHPRRSLMWCR